MPKIGKQTVLAAALLMMSQTLTIARASADAVCFVLREYDGRIALMEEGETDPIAIYNTPISSLYPKDAELLREGIRLENCTELSQLIEDLDLE